MFHADTAGFSAKVFFYHLDLGKIDDEVINPFDHPLFNVWVNFVKMKYKFPHDPYEEMFVTLSSHFGNEKALVDAIFGANIKTIAKELLVYQYNKWEMDGKTAKDVYDILGLKETTHNPFDNPVTLAWVDYVRCLTINDDTAASEILKVVGNNHRDKLYKYFEKATPILKKWKEQASEKTKEQPPKKRKEQAPEKTKEQAPEKQASNLEAPPPPKLLRNFDLNKPAPESI